MSKEEQRGGHVLLCKAQDVHEGTGQTGGMKRMAAFSDVSDKLCASVMTAEPHTSSAVHHHGDQDTVVYAAKGVGAVVFDEGNKRHELSPGDFCLIPAFALHQEVNDSDEQITWIITRSGRIPKVENKDGWQDA